MFFKYDAGEEIASPTAHNNVRRTTIAQVWAACFGAQKCVEIKTRYLKHEGKLFSDVSAVILLRAGRERAGLAS